MLKDILQLASHAKHMSKKSKSDSDFWQSRAKSLNALEKNFRLLETGKAN